MALPLSVFAVLLFSFLVHHTSIAAVSAGHEVASAPETLPEIANRTLNGDPQPKWPRQFFAEFNETTKLLFTWHTQGRWWYDYEQLAERMDRDNGRGDRYCQSIHPRTDTPCTHLVTGGVRYLIFPELGECCACCTAAGGCGVLSPTWLEGAEFEGKEEVQGMPAYTWSAKGLQPNLYTSTSDEARIPLELDQLPNALMALHPREYVRGPVDPSVFTPPQGCKPRCPLLSVCTLLHLRGVQR